MLKFLRDHFNSGQRKEPETPSLELAAAMLLLETADADGVTDACELKALGKALSSAFQLSMDAVATLVDEARELQRSNDGVYVFARRLREAWTVERRIELLTGLWSVVFADGRIDRYEESHLRQVADQLGLVHAEYLQAKFMAGKQASNLSDLG